MKHQLQNSQIIEGSGAEREVGTRGNYVRIDPSEARYRMISRCLSSPHPYTRASRLGGADLLSDTVFCSLMINGLIIAVPTPASNAGGARFTYEPAPGIDVSMLSHLERRAVKLFSRGMCHAEFSQRFQRILRSKSDVGKAAGGAAGPGAETRLLRIMLEQAKDEEPTGGCQ
jgi:hypothetical protein